MAQHIDSIDDAHEIWYDASSMRILRENSYVKNKSSTPTETNSMVKKSINIDSQSSNEVQSSLNMCLSPTNSNHLPLRYGSAADIPYEEGFNLQSIVQSKPNVSSNDIMNLLNDSKIQQQELLHATCTNGINELLINQAHERENLIGTARKAQQDFIDAMNLN